jgi:hypothetical protein
VTDGKNTHEGLFILSQASADLVIPGIAAEPQFASIARDWSFYGESLNTAATSTQRVAQALSDPDAVNRFLAFRAVAEAEKARVIEALVAAQSSNSLIPAIGEEYLALYGSVLNDNSISLATRALFLAEDEAIPTRPDLSFRYQELATARRLMMEAAWSRFHTSIVSLLNHCLEASGNQGVGTPSVEAKQSSQGSQKDGLGARSLRDVLMSVAGVGLTSANATNSSISAAQLGACAARLLRDGRFMSDKIRGLNTVLAAFGHPDLLPSSERAAMLAEAKAAWV